MSSHIKRRSFHLTLFRLASFSAPEVVLWYPLSKINPKDISSTSFAKDVHWEGRITFFLQYLFQTSLLTMWAQSTTDEAGDLLPRCGFCCKIGVQVDIWNVFKKDIIKLWFWTTRSCPLKSKIRRLNFKSMLKEDIAKTFILVLKWI